MEQIIPEIMRWHTQPNTTFLTPTEKDIERLRECMDMRFGTKAIEKTYLNRTQNKSEAANRGLSKSLPKHMEFRRNARGEGSRRSSLDEQSTGNLPT